MEKARGAQDETGGGQVLPPAQGLSVQFSCNTTTKQVGVKISSAGSFDATTLILSAAEADDFGAKLIHYAAMARGEKTQ